jgi:hypothetical protein
MRKGMGKGQGKGYKNLTGRDPRVHSMSAKGMKQPQSIQMQKLRKADDIFRGKYYESGRGRQIVRKWDVKDGGADGKVELTTAIMPSGEKWYELRVRNHYWGQGVWSGRDYENKKTAEKGVKIAMEQLKKMKSQKMSFGQLVRDEGYIQQKKEIEKLQSALPQEDWRT